MPSRLPPRIEDFIPPLIVAENVIEEVDYCVQLDMTRAEMHALADKLAERARAVYATDEDFRRRLQGNPGRDLYFASMRQWLSAELKELRPPAFAELPESFKLGMRLTGAQRPRSPAEIEAAVTEAREMERDVLDELLLSLMEAIDAARKRGERPCLDLSVRLKLDTIDGARKHPDVQLDQHESEDALKAKAQRRASHLRVVT